VRNHVEETPLWAASHAGQTDVVALLIRHGADVNAISGASVPLHVACAFGNIDTVRVLARAGGDVNRADDTGKTPLHLAVMAAFDRSDVVDVLLEHGADPTRKNADGQTPLMLAREWKRTRCAERLSRVTQAPSDAAAAHQRDDAVQ